MTVFFDVEKENSPLLSWLPLRREKTNGLYSTALRDFFQQVPHLRSLPQRRFIAPDSQRQLTNLVRALRAIDKLDVGNSAVLLDRATRARRFDERRDIEALLIRQLQTIRNHRWLLGLARSVLAVQQRTHVRFCQVYH